MNAETNAAALPLIPLAQLRLSARNARKTGNSSPEDLAASIAAIGLLQNLTVLPADAGYEVIAGGRRLAALQLLEQRGELPDVLEAGIPCRIIKDAGDAAIEASAAENTIRERMHPADEFDAFKAMVDNGKPIADVAAHFGVGEIVVKQRLKLANVAPTLIALYRNGGIELDQLQALAITDDHDAQIKTWEGADRWNRDADDLRRALTRSAVSADSGIVQFVGVEAYVAAGGEISRDLFGGPDDAWLSNRPLLDSLAMDKLEAIAQAQRAAGWSWAEAHLSLDYSRLQEYPPLPSYDIAEEFATPEDAERCKQIEARISEIQDMDDDAFDEDEALQEEFSRLDREHDAIEDRMVELWPDEAKAIAGVLVYLDHSGLNIDYGRLRPGQTVSKDGAIAGKPKPTKTEAPAKAKKPVLSADMERRLELHRAAACRQLLATQPALAVQLFVTSLIAQVINRGAPLFDVRIKNVHRDTAVSLFPELAKSDARRLLDEQIKHLLPAMKHDQILPWVQKLSAEKLQEVLALVAAVSLENLRDRQLATLAEQLGCNMTDWWKADPESYLGNVPKALILEAVTEACGKDVAATMVNLKKDALIAEAAKRLAGTGWLPKALRGPGYAVGEKAAKPAKGKAPAKKAAAKKAAKKPAAKKPAKKTPSKKKEA